MSAAFAPIVLANDPLPVEMICAADTVCHAAGDLLMRASTLTAAMRNAAPLDRIDQAISQIGQEARAIASVADSLQATVAALIERGGR